MNDANEPIDVNPSAPNWLDRLVDGELSDNQQRQVLVALEAQPDGWRRCALAFIEAQTWRSDFRGLLAAGDDEGVKPADASAPSSPVTARDSDKLHLSSWLAVAASLLVAFTLGALARAVWQGDAPGGPTTMVAQPGGDGASVHPEDGDAMQIARQTLKVSLPTGDGDEEQFLEVPLMEGSETEMQSLLANETPVLSEAAQQALEQTGHRVQQHRAFYPVRLDDGRQAVLPMDYVEVQYTGGWQ